MKRLLGPEGEEEDGTLVTQSKRPRTLFTSAMREVMGVQSMQRNLSKIEPFLRRVVQEEVQKSICRYVPLAPRPPINQIEAAVNRRYQLRFQNSLPHTLFTGSRIEAEGRLSVQVAIVDTDSNRIICNGPLSSIKIEIVVLDGDFGGDGQEEWTERDFCDSIIREREGKRPLLTGDLDMNLCNGIGYLGDVVFTDNSSWIRSRKFRLGARVSQSRCPEVRVQEAITEAFLVKDHRGELYKKHHPPSLDDDVWRLEKIGKDGAFHRRLAENGIKTVQDFLRNVVMDQDKLRNLLGNGMSNKIWEVTLEHAKECVLDEKHYSYCRGQGVILIFDSIFQLTGAIFDNIYYHLDELTASQKVTVNKLKQLAYRNSNGIVEFNLPVVDTIHRPLPTIEPESLPGSSWSEPQVPDLPVLHHDEPFHQLHASSSEFLDPSQLKDAYTEQGAHLNRQFSSFQTNSFNMRDFLDVQFGEIPASGLPGPIMASEHQLGHCSGADMLASSPLSMLWDHGHELVQASGGEPSFVPDMREASAHISSSKWVKLVAALKWLAISKQATARKAGLELGYPTLAPNMCADARGGWEA